MTTAVCTCLYLPQNHLTEKAHVFKQLSIHASWQTSCFEKRHTLVKQWEQWDKLAEGKEVNPVTLSRRVRWKGLSANGDPSSTGNVSNPRRIVPQFE
jgi:hypothetical protein